ncbi:dihydrouridine synthase, putative [Plasmodium malariae]|uniref:Dihydrouridine synthase, putative n=1 Tax=Plasmodium malariae TaxID=5858 RepID=A0A1C3KBL2_PLAMA|nr:dihydrouridine synthase, putative [Plasmodium malariae]
MQIKLLRSLIISIYFIYFKNHGKTKLNERRYTRVRVYYFFIDKEKFHKSKKKKLWFYTKGKRDLLYGFNNNSVNYKNTIRINGKKRKKEKRGNKERRESKESNMTMLIENNVDEVLRPCENVFKFENISTCLNDAYRKGRSEAIPFIQVAPMINVTNRHFRALVRIITKKAQLWTEMIVDNTLLYNLNKLDEYLGFNKNEHPIVCQLGGCDAISLSEAAILVEQAGYDEINLNVGCPSTKVANRGAFGAYLMKKPEHVRNIVYEIKKKVQIPVSVKIRTGVDEYDSFSFLKSFIETVSSAGCNHFIVHARKAWLKGLDPKQNRSVPPLEYKKVYDLCKFYPNIKFTLNGGVKSIQEAVALLNGYIPQSNKLNGANNGNNKNNNNDTTTSTFSTTTTTTTTTTTDSTTSTNNNNCYDNNNDNYELVENYHINPLYKVYLEQNSIFYNLPSAFELLKPILGILKGMPGHRIFRNKLDVYIRNYASTMQCSEILEKAIIDVDSVAPGCLDLPLNDYKMQREYVKNF